MFTEHARQQNVDTTIEEKGNARPTFLFFLGE